MMGFNTSALYYTVSLKHNKEQSYVYKFIIKSLPYCMFNPSEVQNVANILKKCCLVKHLL